MAERVPGGFASIYAVLKAMEETGRIRRGYFVDGLGGAQFAAPGAVDRLRSSAPPSRVPETLVLSACDPANPYGAALPWPDRERDEGTTRHRAARKAGAVVVLVDGALVLYVERGGRVVLTFAEEPERLQGAVDALVLAVRDGAVGRLSVERVDGREVFDTGLAELLTKAGFSVSPRGLRLRA